MSRRRTPLISGLAAATLTAVTLVVAPATTDAAAPPACTPWTKTTVATGYGLLENIGFDRRGSMLLSESSPAGPGKLVARRANGTKRLVVPDVKGPGGIVVRGRNIFFNTGNTIASGIIGATDGTLDRVNLKTGKRTTVARGLSMPNGLIKIPKGFLVSRDAPVGASTMTLIRPNGKQKTYAPAATSTNGMAYDAKRHRLYVDSTFNPTTTISVINTRKPGRAPRVITLPGIGPLNSADDLTLGRDGQLYVALNVAGQVMRVDPDSGATCVIASGLPFVSSVRFGAGKGWDPKSLYAVTFLGVITKLTP